MNTRIKSIDGWRSMAALGVLYTHSWATLKFPSFKVGPVDLMQVLNLWGQGVHLFFVISGFCFYLVLSRQSAYDLHTALGFWKKRWLRIAPAFYTACLVFALYKFNPATADFYYRVFMNFIFLQNHAPHAEVEAIFWSLAVEWHFYLLLPFIFLLIRRGGILPAVGLLASLHILLNLFHYKGLLMPGDGWYYTIFCNIGHFAWGILTGYLYANRKRISLLSGKASILSGLAIAFIGRTFFTAGFVEKMHGAGFIFQSIGPLIMTFGFACMIYSSLENDFLSAIIGNRLFSALGRISYSFYLWHSFLLELVFERIRDWLPAGIPGLALLMLIVLVILIPVSYTSFRLLESFYFKIQNARNVQSIPR